MNYFLVLILAIIPTLIWIHIFNQENKEKMTTIIFAFLAGCSSTIPVFLYQKLFISEKTGNFIFFKAQAVNFQNNIAEMFGYNSLTTLSSNANEGVIMAILGVFLVFAGVGALEEVVKHVVVNKKATIYLASFAIVISIIFLFKNFSAINLFIVIGLLVIYLVFLRLLIYFIKFESIDDMIEVAIISALGFAFIENIHYFSSKIDLISTGSFIAFVLIRTTIVTVVHVLCSGIMAYHIGLGYFAKPVLQDEIQEGKKFRILQFLHKTLKLPSENIFHLEQIWIGVLLAVFLHALYDFIIQLQWTVFGIIPLFAIMMPIYFIGGIAYLFYILEKKEDHKKFGKIH